MADNAQLEIRLKLEQEVKQRNREQYESMFAGIARIQRDSNLVDYYDEADEIMHALDVPSSTMDLPPDSKVVARYTSMVRRIQGKIATAPQLPGAPGSTPQSNISPLNAAQHAALSSQLGQAGINVNPLANFNNPMRGGAVPPGRGGKGVGQSSLPADIQRFAQQYQAELAQIGDEVFDRLERQVLSDQMRERAIDRARQIRDEASRQALRFPLSGAPRTAIREIERGASEMHRRLSGQASALGFAGAERVRYDQDVISPLQDIVRQGIGGGQINMDDYREARRAAEIRRGEIRTNPDIDPALARRRAESIAQIDRQALQIARLSPEMVQRGTPGRDLASVSPGAVAGFANLQRIRGDLATESQGPLGQLASNRQRELLAELRINQDLNRIEADRLRDAGLMTRERQHRFNVLQNEYRMTERSVEGRPPIYTAGDIARQSAMMGPQGMIGVALQRIAFERGDVQGIGGLAVAGQMVQQRGILGAAMGGLQYGGARAALAGAGALGMPTSGGMGALIGGLGAMAPVVGIGIAAAGAAMVLSQVQSATNLGMNASNLWRRGGGRTGQGTGYDFMEQGGFMKDILNSNAGTAFNRDEALQVAQTLASTGGLRGGGAGDIADRTRSALLASRSLGFNPATYAQGVGTMESMNLVGTGPNRFSQERFADMMASAINRGGMRGRESDVMTSIASLTQALAIRGMTTPEMTQNTIGLITAMNASGAPGLRGAAGNQLLGAMDQSITGARGLQEALLYQAYQKQAGGKLGYLEFIEEQGKGVGSQYAMGAAGDIANLGGQDPRRRALALITQYFGGDRSKMGQAMQMDELIRNKQLTPENFASLTSGTAETEGYKRGDQLESIEQLTEETNKLTQGFQDWASTLLPTITALKRFGNDLMDASKTLSDWSNIQSPLDAIKDVATATATAVAGAIAAAFGIRLPEPGGGAPGAPGPNGVPTRPLTPAERLPPPLIIPGPSGGPGGTPGSPGAGPNWGTTPGPSAPPGYPNFGGRPQDYPSTPSSPSPNWGGGPEAYGMPSTPEGEGSPSALPQPTSVDQFQGIRQPTNDTCGPTSMAMILTNAGMPTTAVEAREAMRNFLGHDPIGPQGMQWGRVAEFVNWYATQHGNPLRAGQGPTRAQIMENMEKGQPVMFSINTAAAQRLNLPSGAIPHIVAGVSASNGRYTLADPATGRLFHLDRDQMSQLASDNDSKSVLFQGYYGPGSSPATPGLPPAGDEALPITGSPGGTIGGTEDQNRAAVARTARELGMNPQLAFAGVLQEGGFVDPMRYEANDPGERRSLIASRNLTGRGMYQFSYTRTRSGAWAGELGGYVNFLKEMGIIHPTDSSYDLIGQTDAREIEARVGRLMDVPGAWTPEIQTRYFARYAARRGVDIGASYPSARALSQALTRIQAPGDQSGNAYIGVAGDVLSGIGRGRIPDTTPVVNLPYMDPGGSTLPVPEPPPQSYTPMDQSAMGAIRVSLQATTLTLMWPDGSPAGEVEINGTSDVPSSTDVNAYRGMGYYG